MVSTCSSNSRLIKRNNSSVGMSNKLGVQVKRSVIAVANSSNGSSSNSRNSSNDRGSSSISSFLGSKMVRTCSSNSWFISRDNSSIRKTYKLCVQVERSSIAIANSSNGSSSISNSLGSKMISTGSSNSWFIKRNNSSIGMSNE